MIAIIFFALLAFVLLMILALCRNAKRMDEKEWREMEKEYHLRHFEEVNK